MATDTIAEFLVALGFKVDEHSQKKFETGIDNATKAVAGMVVSLEAAATAVTAWAVKMANSLEAIYFASQRAGASALNMKALDKAAQNLGASAGEGAQAIQSIARFLRENPGGEGMLKGLGIQTRSANGELRDTADMLADLGPKLAAMPYYLASQYAGMFGISENVLIAMRNGDFTRELEQQRALLKDSGYEEASRNAHELAETMREMETRFEAVRVKVANGLFKALQPEFDRLAQWFDDHAVQIAEWSSKFAEGIVKAGEIIIPILSMIADGWGKIYDLTSAAIISLGAYLGLQEADRDAGIKALKEGSWFEASTKLPALDFLKAAQARANGEDPVKAILGDRPSAPAPAPASGGSNEKQKLSAIEKKYGLPPGLLDSVWSAESGRGKHMRSAAGAEGHFQFMPATARQYGLDDPYDFDQSADAAGRYYRDLLARYGDNLQKAVAAYNWGPGNVDRYGLGRAPLETRGYVGKVTGGMSGVQINHSTEINVHGVTDPGAAGREVANQQRGVNQDLSRSVSAVAG